MTLLRPALLAAALLAAPLLATAVLLPAPVLAHDEAAWIEREPRYRMRHSSSHCCDPSHCRRIPASFVLRVAEGWRAGTGEVFLDERQGLYQSIDQDWWACGSAETTWCLFVPGVEG